MMLGMKMMVKIRFILCFFWGTAVGAQAQIVLDPVVVTASRLNSALVSDLRESAVLTRREIAALPAASVTELLTYLGQAEFQQRAPGGVQADFGLRGSSFEQVVILLNGVRMNDPQTGHHNGDLPVTLDEIERIEVLPGHASSMYGADAFGGVIHLITRTPRQSGAKVRFQGGSYHTLGASLNGQWLKGGWTHQLGLERRSSRGHREDTEYLVQTASLSSEGRIAGAQTQWRTAVTAKDFGANGFYAPLPSWEATRTYVAQGGVTWMAGRHGRLKTQASIRHHQDHFILDVQRPDYYVNRQNTWTSAVETQWNGHLSDRTEAAIGAEWSRDALESASLGNHHQQRLGLYGESALRLAGEWLLHGGLRVDAQSGRPLQISPTVGLRLPISPGWIGRVSVGRAYRAPTFTERYYRSPANVGDPDLEPESAWSLEAGGVVQGEGWKAEATGFVRREDHRIDWIVRQPNGPWEAVNLGQMDLVGLSLRLTFHPLPGVGCNLFYTGMDRRDRDEASPLTKYSWTVASHRLQSGVDWRFGRTTASWITRYIHREDGASLWLMDGNVETRWGRVGLGLSLKNLLDTDYEEIRGVPLPGRHVLFHTTYGF